MCEIRVSWMCSHTHTLRSGHHGCAHTYTLRSKHHGCAHTLRSGVMGVLTRIWDASIWVCSVHALRSEHHGCACMTSEHHGCAHAHIVEIRRLEVILPFCLIELRAEPGPTWFCSPPQTQAPLRTWRHLSNCNGKRYRRGERGTLFWPCFWLTGTLITSLFFIMNFIISEGKKVLKASDIILFHYLIVSMAVVSFSISSKSFFYKGKTYIWITINRITVKTHMTEGQIGGLGFSP